MVFGIPIEYIDFLSAIIFIIIMGIFLYRSRKKLSMQALLRLPKVLGKVPIIYILLLKTKWGLSTMENLSKKYREHVKLFGYISIGLGFMGMVVMFVSVLWMLFLFIFKPASPAGNVALVLPFTNVPGLGYLSFWHFLISLFVIATVHEFAHGVVARAHNVNVKASGIGVLGLLFPIFPLAFVEPDEKNMKKQEDIVQYSVFAAGPVVNLLLALIFMLFFNFALAPVEAGITEPAGFSYEVINNSFPASVMPNSTIISLNGEEIEVFNDFANGMMCIGPSEEIEIGTENGTYTIVTTANPDDDTKGFIGIRPIQNEGVVKDRYKLIAAPFAWVMGLFRWLFFLNLAVGLINLLPVFIVDGGRMFQIATQRLVKNKDRAMKIISYIGFLCLFILLFGLAKTYITKIFGFFG